MGKLTVTAKGQVTLRREILRHLGVHPGERIDIELLPGGRVSLSAAKPTGAIDGFIGVLAGKTRKVGSIEEIDDAAHAGWAGEP